MQSSEIDSGLDPWKAKANFQLYTSEGYSPVGAYALLPGEPEWQLGQVIWANEEPDLEDHDQYSCWVAIGMSGTSMAELQHRLAVCILIGWFGALGRGGFTCEETE